MRNDKMYAEFKSWWYASKYCQVVNSSESARQTAWDGWKASRESLAIKLPYDSDALNPENSFVKGWRCGVEEMKESIEAAGLKVKP